MTNKKLVILGLLAVVSVIWAVIQSHISGKSHNISFAESYLIQGLETSKIAAIVVGSGDDAIRFERQEGRFLVTNKNNYPASTGRINELISSCLDIRTQELVTADPANHETLEVAENKNQNIVKFLADDDETITAVIIGKTEPQTGSSYVRSLPGDTVYTTTNRPLIPTSEIDYIKTDLLNIERDDMLEVTVAGPNDSYTLTIGDGNNSGLVLKDKPAGSKLKTVEAEQVFLALSYLTFEDVNSESSVEKTLEFDNSYTCRLNNQVAYNISIATSDGKNYIKCSADYLGPSKIVKENKLESPAELKAKEAKLLARSSAEEFAQKHKGWVYEIALWKGENLTKKLQELLEPPAKGIDQSPAEKTSPAPNVELEDVAEG